MAYFIFESKVRIFCDAISALPLVKVCPFAFMPSFGFSFCGPLVDLLPGPINDSTDGKAKA